VLSTLHTNSALGAISRLQDMGVEPFLLQRRQHQVAGERGLNGDLRGFAIADFAHQHHVRITNSALGAISRLQDMGVEPFLLSTSLLAVMSQRLVLLAATAACRSGPPSAGRCRHPPAWADGSAGTVGVRPV
jgi:type II secretory ATPase GspE/PulE/Tfp pilus assembly ATPase PilB-like protein